ncbi:MAG: hypothetical protein ACYCZ8_14450 [Acidimicrobiales bacterium]
MSAEGFRVIWVRSSHRVGHDAGSRSHRVAAGIAALDQLIQKLVSKRCRLKTTVAVGEAANEAVGSVGATPWVGSVVEQYEEVRHRQETRVRPGANTRSRQITRTKHPIHFEVNEGVISAAARSGSCGPLITKEKEKGANPADILFVYKRQTRRLHHQLKGDQARRPHVPPRPGTDRGTPRRARDVQYPLDPGGMAKVQVSHQHRRQLPTRTGRACRHVGPQCSGAVPGGHELGLREHEPAVCGGLGVEGLLGVDD